MLTGIEKLKQRTESIPKFSATQVQVHEFPIFIFDLDSEIDASEIEKICLDNRLDKFKADEKVAVYAWRSDYLNYVDNPIPEFSKLFQVVENKIKQVWKMRYSFTIDHYWYAIYNNGDNAVKHNHGWVDYACVYYVKTPENSAPLVIPSKDQNIVIHPKAGQLVAFPGNCDHEVPVSNHNGERIIVAMNIVRDKLLGPDLNNIKK